MNAGLIFNTQRFSLQDGPGLRTTVFLKGCPLACLWCHNPEGWKPRPELLRDRIFFDESDGGVTFSGGEPLMQPEFLIDCLERLRAESVHTALDTCGHAPWPRLEQAARLAALVLYDVKMIDEDRHQAATGQSNRLILENLQALAGLGTPLWIRVPVIPGINDDDENIEATAALLADLATVARVDLLPYHGIGESKFARLGGVFKLPGLESPGAERFQALAARFRARGLYTHIGERP